LACLTLAAGVRKTDGVALRKSIAHAHPIVKVRPAYLEHDAAVASHIATSMRQAVPASARRHSRIRTYD